MKKLPLQRICLTAMILEVVNFVLALSFPIDVGLPSGTNWTVQTLFEQAIDLHYPGFLLLFWMDKFPRTTTWSLLFYPAFFLIGYIDTVVLLIVVVFAYRLLRWLVEALYRQHKAPQH